MTSVRRAVRLVGAAVQLLSRIPLGIPVDAEELTAARPLFPLVGVLVGAVGVAARAAAQPAIGAVAATVLAVAVMVTVTGALHEDGLADTADGIWGGRTSQERLTIMRDPGIGTYGTMALLLALAFRLTLLAPLGLTDFARATIAGQVVGRASAVAVSATLPAAAPTGSGRVVAGPLPGGAAVAVAVFAALAAVLAAGVWAPVIVTAAGLVVVGLHLLSKARLGGVTGDVLGAVTVLADLATLAVAVALF